MARLIVVTPDGETTVDLDGRPLTVGRDPTADIPLVAEPKASRRHCRIAPSGAGWEVADLGSTNGTRVNGATAEKKVLSTGDTIEIGAVRIRYEDPAEADRLRAAGAAGVCYLEWVSNGKKGERVMLSAQRTSIGRRDTNTIALKDRMASGHHAEIVRDLNGYTLRDLGSTNGTLVNGEPTSETVLTHGMRIRIGNSKFVFKDPSMKDIEVELSQFDEDGGWGMMGDIDLSRARGSKVGLLAVLVLFAGAGAGLWWLGRQERTTSVAASTSNRIENGEFEDVDVPWAAEAEDLVDVARVPAPGGRGGSALSLTNRVDAAEDGAGSRTVRVESLNELERLGRRPFRVRAKFRAVSGAPDLSVVWDSRPAPEERTAGVVPLSRTVPLPVGSGGTVDAAVAPPSWAAVGRLVVRLPPGSKALLDSVSAELADEDPPETVIEGPDSRRPLAVDPSGAADLVATRTVLMASAVPIARTAASPEPLVFRAESVEAGPKDAEGRGSVLARGTFSPKEGEPLPGSVTWTATEEGFRAEVGCEGAAAVGLATDLVGVHLGGAVNVLGAFPPQPLPTTPGQRLEGVAKVLAGDAEGATGRALFVAFLLGEGAPQGTLEVVPSDDATLVRLNQWLPGAKGVVQVVTSFGVQKRRAEQRLAEARAILGDRPGRAIRTLRELAQEFPFDKTIGGEALRLADERETKAQEDVEKLAGHLRDYRVYRSGAALDLVEKEAKTLAAQFLADGAGADANAGPIETRVAELGRQVAEERREHDVQNALPEVIRLERIAALLSEDQAYVSLAALYARAILRRFGAWAGEDSDIGRRVGAIRKTLESWRTSPEVAAALPPEPGAEDGN